MIHSDVNVASVILCNSIRTEAEEKKLKILLREKTSGMSRADERRKICALSKERVKNSCRRRNFTTCGFHITFFTLSFYITTMM